jgi:hypothetical protein
MATFEGTYLHDVKCYNNALINGTDPIGLIKDDGVELPNGKKLEFFLRSSASPDIPITFNRDCQMIYNDGRFNDDGTPVKVDSKDKKGVIYLKTQTTGGKKRRSSHKNAGHRTKNAGHRTKNAGHRTKNAGHRTKNAGHHTVVIKVHWFKNKKKLFYFFFIFYSFFLLLQLTRRVYVSIC